MAHDALTEGVLRNLIHLQRVSNGLSADVRLKLRDLFDELAAVIAKHDPTSVQPRYQRARVDKIMAEVERLTGQRFREVRKALRDDLARLAVQQADSTLATLGKATELAAQLKRGAMSMDLARTILARDPFQGLTLAEWSEGQSVQTVQRVRRQIQLGMFEGDSIDDMVRRIRGRSNGRGGYIGGVMETTTREAEMVVRTAVNWISNDAMLRTYKANADVITALEWTATLDARTCLECGEMDGRTWKMDDPSIRRPPLHPNDRCVMVPVVDWEGLGLEPPEPGTRAARDDTGKSVQVDSQTRYEDWLRSKSAALQDEILGAGRGKLFRKGTSLADMVRNDGSIIRLDELT